MKQATITINAAENGYTIDVQAQHEVGGATRAVPTRRLVATGDPDARKKLHEVVDALFEPPKEPAKKA